MSRERAEVLAVLLAGLSRAQVARESWMRLESYLLSVSTEVPGIQGLVTDVQRAEALTEAVERRLSEVVGGYDLH